jgi:hypothetical protein
MRQNLQNCLDQIKVECVVLNALTVDAALPPDICAFGELVRHRLRRSRSTWFVTSFFRSQAPLNADNLNGRPTSRFATRRETLGNL